MAFTEKKEKKVSKPDRWKSERDNSWQEVMQVKQYFVLLQATFHSNGFSAEGTIISAISAFKVGWLVKY